MIVQRVKAKVAILGVLFIMFSGQGQTAQISEPQLLVQHVTESMLKALQQNKDQLENNPNLIYSLVREIILPNFDFHKMAKLALGKNWRTANKAQREKFTHEFQFLLVRTYSTAMIEYSDQDIRLLPFHDDVSKKKVKVAIEILQSSSPSIQMSFSIYLDKYDTWKVYDVKIDGISLVVNYRSVFTKKIRDGGMDKLIADLVSKNRTAKDI